MSEEKPTFAQCFGGRDACCMAAVGNMAAMGRFETSGPMSRKNTN